MKSFCFSVFLCCYNFVINFNSSPDISAAFISCSSNTNPFTTYTSTDISTLLIFFSSADVSTQFSAYTLTDTSNPFRSSPLNNNNKKKSSPNFQRSYTFNSNCFQCRTADTSPCFSVHTWTCTKFFQDFHFDWHLQINVSPTLDTETLFKSSTDTSAVKCLLFNWYFNFFQHLLLNC